MTSADLRLVILLLTTCANLVLGVAVWRKNPRQRVNQSFALLSVTVAAWALVNGFVNAYAETPEGVIWARGAFVSAAAIPIAFLLFVSAFPTPQPAPPRTFSTILFISGGVVAILSTTPLIARSTSSLDGVLRVTYGPLHPLFGIYFISSLTFALVFLYRKLKVLTGVERLQVRYVFLGISLPILGGTITNLLIPLAFGSSQFSQVGPLFSILMISLIAHAIIRYRLMNIRLAMRRGLVYLLAISTVSALFVLILWLGSKLFPFRSQVPIWIELLLVVVIAVLFNPLKGHVQRWADRYFFREPYDYQRVVRDVTRNMAAILDLQSLLKYSCDAITKTVQAEYAAAYAKDSAGGLYRRLVVHRAVADAPEIAAIDSNSLLPVHLSKTLRPVLIDELAHAATPSDLRHLRDELRRLRAEIVLPIHDEDTLTGFFLIGPKLAADPYFSEDIDLLTTLTSQATIAIKNAQLYSQVVLANDYVENILDTIDSAVIALDRDGTVTRFNSAAERLTGMPSAQVKGRSFRDLPRSISRLLQATSQDRQPRTQVETTVSDEARHHVVPVICSTAPLVDRGGSVLGTVAVVSDLTGIKRLEEEKRQVERLASVGALASGIAHEIKNPLVAIKTFAELLPERFSEDDFRNDFSRVAIREIARIDDLVARLRGLAVSPQHSLVPLDLKTPLEETLALLRGQLEQRQISLGLEFEDALPPVAASFAQLKQLFLNLLVNAVEASQPGAQISIRVRSQLTSDGRGVIVEISDSGPGIPDDLLSRIFEPFVTTKPQGSGLGLSICRGIADAHRAKISAFNNPRGRGATVSVEFPSASHIPTAAIAQATP
jgi:PAS domain S-box-containing protein